MGYGWVPARDGVSSRWVNERSSEARRSTRSSSSLEAWRSGSVVAWGKPQAQRFRILGGQGSGRRLKALGPSDPEAPSPPQPPAPKGTLLGRRTQKHPAPPSPQPQKELYSGMGVKQKRLATDATPPRFQSMWLLLSARVCEVLGPWAPLKGPLHIIIIIIMTQRPRSVTSLFSLVQRRTRGWSGGGGVRIFHFALSGGITVVNVVFSKLGIS